MELVSALFHVLLVIFHSIDVGEASSDDEGERKDAGKVHKWTTNEEFKLIFFDVSTDTGEKNHFNRIREKWRREYPESDVSDMALKSKIRKLREDSLETVCGKKNFKWDAQLVQELVDVYHTTHPYVKNANVSLIEEWKRRHPNFRGTGEYLLWRVKRIFPKYNYLRNRIPGSSITSSLVEDPGGKIQHQWTEYEKAKLLYFQKLTSTEKGTQLSRIKLMWRKEFPESNVTDTALRLMLRKLQRESRKKGERQKFLRWLPDEEKMLLDTYLNSYPYRKDVNVTFGELWKQRQEGSIGDERYLMKRAQKLLEDNKYPEYSARAFFKRNFQSDEQRDPQHLDMAGIKIREDKGFSLRQSRGESQAGSSRMEGHKRNMFLPKKKSSKKILERRKGAEPEKRFGKAPIVYSSEEPSSSSSPMVSEDSE